MNQIRPEQLDYDLKRWMRPDAGRFIRSDWRRYVKAGSDLERFYELYEFKYRPDQPRVPAGSREGGQWTADGGQTHDAGGSADDETDADERVPDGLVRLAQVNYGVVTDAFGEPYYNPGGHHEVARSVYNQWNLRPETRAVFDKATTGTVPRIKVRVTPDGASQDHSWSKPHREYNNAVEELARNFFEAKRITPGTMSPDHAHEMLKEIRESKDPRIRNYNDFIRIIRRVYRLRRGRE